MNKQAISTIIASAALGIIRSTRRNSGNRNQSVSINNIDDLKKYVSNPQLAKTVTEVDIYNNALLTEIPGEIGNLINLKELILYENQITSLPREIGKLINLEILVLSNNQIKEIPKEIGNLTNLKVIYMDQNKITSLPREIGKLTNLTELHLEKNQITSLPRELCNITNLEELSLYENSIQSPTKEELINLWLSAGFSPKVVELLLPQLPSEQSSIRRF